MISRIIPVGILFLGTFVTGCATRVFPPKAPPSPTTIYLCDYGEHSGLLLPNGDGRFVEYVYGDWDYAALNKTDPWHTFVALFFSPQPALGRRYLTPKPGEAFPHPPNNPHGISPLVVSNDKLVATVKTMDERYQKHVDTALYNDAPNYDYTFVKDDQPYRMWHSCNQLTVTNLKSMNCDIGGFPILANFLVEAPR